MSCNLSSKVKLYFNDMIKTHLLMINNLNVFTRDESLFPNAIKCHQKLIKLKTKFRENIASSRFNYKG